MPLIIGPHIYVKLTRNIFLHYFVYCTSFIGVFPYLETWTRPLRYLFARLLFCGGIVEMGISSPFAAVSESKL